MSDSELQYLYKLRMYTVGFITFHIMILLYSDIPAPTIFQLTSELIEMMDWYSLGVALRVHPNKLQEIQKSCPQEGIQRWRIDMLQHWLNSTPDASWNDIIAALKKIGHHTLSAKLREKYNLPLAGQQDCSTPPNDTGLAIVPSTTTITASGKVYSMHLL